MKWGFPDVYGLMKFLWASVALLRGLHNSDVVNEGPCIETLMSAQVFILWLCDCCLAVRQRDRWPFISIHKMQTKLLRRCFLFLESTNAVRYNIVMYTRDPSGTLPRDYVPFIDALPQGTRMMDAFLNSPLGNLFQETLLYSTVLWTIHEFASWSQSLFSWYIHTCIQHSALESWSPFSEFHSCLCIQPAASHVIRRNFTIKSSAESSRAAESQRWPADRVIARNRLWPCPPCSCSKMQRRTGPNFPPSFSLFFSLIVHLFSKYKAN